MKKQIQDLEEDIANIIKGIAYYDIIIENEKIKIAENPNFDALTAWRQMDLNQSGYIDAQSLNKFLSANRIAASTKECQYILNLSTLNKQQMSKQEFLQYILPKTNPKLKLLSLRRREIQLQGKHAHFLSDQVITRSSEYLASQIILLEIRGFREIEDLRKNFKNMNKYNIQQIFQVVDNDNKGVIDFEVLHRFMKRNDVQFNEDEFHAFLSRTTEDGDSKLDYEELIIALMPIDPYIYPHYREEFNPTQNNRYIIKKAQEFKTDALNPPVYFEITKQAPKLMVKSNSTANTKHYSYNYPMSKVYDPYQNGRPTYVCDEGYMGQLRSYKEAYYNPSRDNSVQCTNRFQEGMRYHDQHFQQFYKFLHDRDQNEQLFNKFGKRYAYDEGMQQIRDEMTGINELPSQPSKMQQHQESQRNQSKYIAETVRFNYKPGNQQSMQTEFNTVENLKTVYNQKPNVEPIKNQIKNEEVDFDEFD